MAAKEKIPCHLVVAAHLDVSVRHLLRTVRPLSRCGYNGRHFTAVSCKTKHLV